MVTFKDLAKTLAKDYQVLSVDLPGFGKTEAPKEVWDLDNYSEFLESLLKKLGLHDLYAVVGHSNGGAIAIRAINLGKLKPKKLVLLSAAGIRSGQTLKRVVLKIIAKTGNIATIWMPERNRRALRESLYGAAGSDMLVVPGLQETFKKSVRQDVQADAAKLTLPTLLIFAQGDKAVPVSDGRSYNRLIKKSKLEVLGDSGHFVHHDQPAETLRLIKEFLK